MGGNRFRDNQDFEKYASVEEKMGKKKRVEVLRRTHVDRFLPFDSLNP